MSVTLSPISPRCAVSDADDPYKKYWWAILLGFACIGLWLLTPMMGEKPVGSIGAEGMGKLKTDADVEQSLATADAAGNEKEKSMAGSMLEKSAPGDLSNANPPAASAAVSPASPATLAGALKKIGSGAGGWGEKAQKGFNAPKLAGGAPSGMNAAGGGRAGSPGSGAFGASRAEIGYAAAKSLSGGNDSAGGPSPKGLAALKSIAASAAAGRGGGDGAVVSLSRAFDGAKGRVSIGGAGGAALGGAYAALDAAPANLKLNDPSLNGKTIEAPPAVAIAAGDRKDGGVAKQLAMSMIGVVVGGVIGGMAGGIAMQVISQAAAQQAAQQAEQERKAREFEDRRQLDAAKRRVGFRPNEKE